MLFVCDKKFAPQAKKILASAKMPVTLQTVSAGKLRRYHTIPLWKQLLDIPTVAHNLRDMFLIAAGFLQSVHLLRKFRPDVVFTKGGFVCLPVGYAAHLRKIPLVIHDSDAHPGLTNRILARWASAIATGAPLENYQYPADKTVYAGIPVAEAFHSGDEAQKRQAKEAVQQDPARPLVVATGGGLGALRLNRALVAIAGDLVAAGAEVVHVTGAAHGEAIAKDITEKLGQNTTHYHVKPFVAADEMARLLTAADVVVSRAGATTMAELAALGKATILVPNPILTAGHQLKNAEVWQRADAAIVLDEQELADSPEVLQKKIIELLSQPQRRQHLESAIKKFAMPDAAKTVAQLILEVQRRGV